MTASPPTTGNLVSIGIGQPSRLPESPTVGILVSILSGTIVKHSFLYLDDDDCQEVEVM